MKTAEDLAREYAEREASANEKLTLEPFGIEELKTYAYHDFLAGYNAREQWISVEDRLPDSNADVNQRYVVINHCGGIGVMFFDCKSNKFYGYPSIQEITQYMPIQLPNAPKP